MLSGEMIGGFSVPGLPDEEVVEQVVATSAGVFKITVEDSSLFHILVSDSPPLSAEEVDPYLVRVSS